MHSLESIQHVWSGTIRLRRIDPVLGRMQHLDGHTSQLSLYSILHLYGNQCRCSQSRNSSGTPNQRAPEGLTTITKPQRKTVSTVLLLRVTSISIRTGQGIMNYETHLLIISFGRRRWNLLRGGGRCSWVRRGPFWWRHSIYGCVQQQGR